MGYSTPEHARAPALAQGRHLPIVRNRLPTLRSSLSLQDLAPGRMQCLPGAFCDTPQRCRGFFLKQRVKPACGRSRDRKSVVWGESVSVRVDLGGRRVLKKKKNKKI